MLNKVKEALLPDGVLTTAFGTGINPAFGGQFGYSPKLGRVGEDGQLAAEWISNEAYTKNNTIAFLLQPPLMFTKYFADNGAAYIAILKALIEQRSETIEGLVFTRTNEFEEHMIGGSGQVQHENTDSKVESSNVTHMFREVPGKTIHHFFELWSDYGLRDFNTKHSRLALLDAYDGAPITAEMRSMTVLYVEPDITMTRVQDAILRTNMMPTSTGPVELKSDKNSPGEMIEMPIEFTGFNTRNNLVYELAQNMLTAANLKSFDSSKTPIFLSTDATEAVDPSVRADKTPIGVAEQGQ